MNTSKRLYFFFFLRYRQAQCNTSLNTEGGGERYRWLDTVVGPVETLSCLRLRCHRNEI